MRIKRNSLFQLKKYFKAIKRTFVKNEKEHKLLKFFFKLVLLVSFKWSMSNSHLTMLIYSRNFWSRDISTPPLDNPKWTIIITIIIYTDILDPMDLCRIRYALFHSFLFGLIYAYIIQLQFNLATDDFNTTFVGKWTSR